MDFNIIGRSGNFNGSVCSFQTKKQQGRILSRSKTTVILIEKSECQRAREVNTRAYDKYRGESRAGLGVKNCPIFLCFLLTDKLVRSTFAGENKSCAWRSVRNTMITVLL